MSNHVATNLQMRGWRPIVIAGTGVAILAISGFGVSASLNATATNASPEAVSSGTLSLGLTNAGQGFGQSITGMIPGDVVNRYVDLTNTGDVAANGMAMSIASTGTGTLLADGVAPVTTKALRVTVSTCATAWNTSTGACTGGATAALSASTVGSLSSAASLITGPIAVGEVRHLQVSAALPDQNETTVNGVTPGSSIQGGSASLTYTFAVAQRAATTTSS